MVNDGVGGQPTAEATPDIALTPDTAPDTVDALVAEVQAGGSLPPEDIAAKEQEIQRLRASLDEQCRIQAGLDRANTKLQGQAAQSQGRIKDLETRLGQFGTADGANNDVIADLQLKLEQEQQERAIWQQQAEGALRDAERTSIVATEFPELMPLVAGGALPDADNSDQFRERMTGIAAALESKSQGQHQQKMRGARPPASPPAQSSPADLASLATGMNDALAADDDEAFARLKEQWYATQGNA